MDFETKGKGYDAIARQIHTLVVDGEMRLLDDSSSDKRLKKE